MTAQTAEDWRDETMERDDVEPSVTPVQMKRSQILLGACAALNSALYLIGITVISELTGHHLPAILAVATAGICFLSYSFQIATAGDNAVVPPWLTRTTIIITALSSIVGLAAGIALMWAI